MAWDMARPGKRSRWGVWQQFGKDKVLRKARIERKTKETEIVAAPVLVDNLLLISTDKGLIAATPAQATDTRTNAVKKP